MCATNARKYRWVRLRFGCIKQHVEQGSIRPADLDFTKVPRQHGFADEASSGKGVHLLMSDSTNALAGRAIGPPLISPPVLNGNDFTFSFDTLNGFTYVVQYKNSFDDPIWQTLQSAAGDGTPKTITVPLSDALQRFYRLSVQ